MVSSLVKDTSTRSANTLYSGTVGVANDIVRNSYEMALVYG